MPLESSVDPTKLYPLLFKRMQEFDIPAWPGQACFERVLVFRLPDEAAKNEKFGSESMIYKPDARKLTDEARSPRGIIVSAGLKAMDVLRDHGMQVGELVWFAPHVPWRYEVGRNDKGPIEFYFMNVGDIILSEDILNRVMSGEIEQKVVNGKALYGTPGAVASGGREDPQEFQDSI